MAKDVLAKLATKPAFFVVDKFEIKLSWPGTVKAGKGFTLFILNEDLDDLSGLLIDCAAETVKHEIKEQEAGFHSAIMTPMAASLITPMTSSLM